MLPWLLPLIALTILPIVLRLFAEDGPDNGVVHYSGGEDEPPDSRDGDPDVPLAA